MTPLPHDSDSHADQLAHTLFRAAMHKHADPNLSGPWRQESGRHAFDVTLMDGDDLPSGFTARVIVTVSGSSAGGPTCADDECVLGEHEGQHVGADGERWS